MICSDAHKFDAGDEMLSLFFKRLKVPVPELRWSASHLTSLSLLKGIPAVEVHRASEPCVPNPWRQCPSQKCNTYVPTYETHTSLYHNPILSSWYNTLYIKVITSALSCGMILKISVDKSVMLTSSSPSSCHLPFINL